MFKTTIKFDEILPEIWENILKIFYEIFTL